MEHPSGDDGLRQSETMAMQAEVQARALSAESKPGQPLQPPELRAGSQELLNEKGKADNGKSSKEFKKQDSSANSSMKTALAERTPIAGSDIPSISGQTHLDGAAPFNKSFDVALDRLIRHCTETPSWRTKNSLHTTVAPSGAGSHDPSSINSESLSKDPAVGNHRSGYKFHNSHVNTAHPAPSITPTFSPPASTIQAPRVLYNRAEPSFAPSLSNFMLSRSPQPYEYKVHKAPSLRTYRVGSSETPAKNAWHGYENMYERQETHRYNFADGSIDCMRGYTPADTLWLEGFEGPKEHFAHPHRGFDSFRHGEKADFQHRKKHGLDYSSLLNEHPEGLRGSTYHIINSPASHDPFANVINQDGFQAYQEYSQDQQSALGVDTRLEEGQNYPQHNLSNLEQPRDRTEQDSVLLERIAEEIPCLWNQVSPSHTAQALDGSAENPSQSSAHQDEEGNLAGFWKPHLLY